MSPNSLLTLFRVPLAALSSLDLQDQGALVSSVSYHATASHRGAPHALLLDVLHVPGAARLGIAWGASASWADMRPGESVEQLVELYLSDPDAYAARE